VISTLLLLGALTAQAGDQELFNQARSLWDQGQQQEAFKACKELIKKYPTSKYVPEAYLMFAEYFFDNAQLDKALQAYKKVTEFKDSKVYSYALYKMGWCYFNLNKFDKALALFVNVVKHCDKQDRSAGEKSKLRTEALNDLTLAYSHAKGAKAAPAFFQKLAPNEAGQLLLALAGMYFGDGKYKDAMEVYRELLPRRAATSVEDHRLRGPDRIDAQRTAGGSPVGRSLHPAGPMPALAIR
jgi:tetratricopeptide (TPR) repeat protein